MIIHKLLKTSTICTSKINVSSLMIEDKVKVDNIEINCLRNGNGEHKIFLLPGSVGTIWTDFSPQITGFDSNKFTLICWDPPGYGKSRPPERDFSHGFYERDADVAVKLLKVLNIDKCSLLGWSDGGITSLIIAAKYPELVNKLIIWGANASVTDDDLKAYRRIQCIDNWSTSMRDTMTSIYGYDVLQTLMNNWVEGMEEIKRKYNGDICKEIVSKIIAPTLILHGEKDPLVPAVHYNFLHRSIPRSKLHLFADGKHNIHLKYAESFNKIVQSFLLRSDEECSKSVL